jgi:glycosyltransferase involved in cell wall biosynthesis
MGVVGLNLAARLPDCSLFVLGPRDCPPGYADAIDAAEARAGTFDPDAPSVRYWHPNDLAHHVGRGPRCGYAIWEQDPLPPQAVHHLLSQDLVLCPTHWQAESAARMGVPRDRLRVVPHGVDADVFYPTPLPAGPTTFLVTGKWEVRKGHDVVPGLFDDAFTPADDVLLIAHCHNPFLTPGDAAEWEAMYRNTRLGRAGKVQVSAGRFGTQDELAALYARAHCVVALSRAEGWGFAPLEAMACGRHVVATHYSGHTEFLTPSCAHLVDCPDREAAFDGRWFRGTGEWARLGPNQHEQALWYLRHVHRARTEGRLPVNTPGVRRAGEFSWEASTEALEMAVG